MILLDTNVVSELMRAQRSPVVTAWVAAQRSDTLFLSAITEAELRYGAARLPNGRRKTGLLRTINAMLAEDFATRILPFDSTAAIAYAVIASARRKAGLPISIADAQIAAIAAAHGAALATRNTRDFEASGVALLNPWAIQA